VRPLLSRPLVGLGTLALAASVLLSTGQPASAAPPDSTLTITVVDQYGRPAPALIQTVDASGTSYFAGPGNTPTVVSTHTLVVPSDQSYSFIVAAPWGGLQCIGVSPCGPSPSPSYTPVVTIPLGAPAAAYKVDVTLPSVTGGPAVGSPLTVQVPAAIEQLNALVAGYPGPLATLPTTIGQQWTRGGSDIANATGASYTTVRGDGGQTVAARLSPSQRLSAFFSQAGYSIPPLTTNSVAVAKTVPLKTTTKVNVAKSFRVGQKVTMAVKVKAKGATTRPDGKVVVSIGTFKTAKKLDDDGEALINLPHLSPGTYKVSVKYAGSEDFKKSKAKKITLTVRK
jgi:hypothetical protein